MYKNKGGEFPRRPLIKGQFRAEYADFASNKDTAEACPRRPAALLEPLGHGEAVGARITNENIGE